MFKAKSKSRENLVSGISKSIDEMERKSQLFVREVMGRSCGYFNDGRKENIAQGDW